MNLFFIEMKIIQLEIMMMNFRDTEEFNKDFKKLSKKFRTLDDDLLEFKKILNKFPLGIGKHFNVITKTDSVQIIKARFFCKSLRKSDLRIIYAYINEDKTIELIGVEFIELYFKGNQVSESRKRIEEYLKKDL